MQRAGRCWAGRCCHEASLPPKLGLRNLATFSPGALSPHRLARASPLPSPLGNSMEDRAVTRVGPGPRAALPGWPGAHSVSPSVPLRGAEMKIKPRSSSPLLPEEKPDPRPWPPQGSGQPISGSACTPKTAREANQVKRWPSAQPRGKWISSHSPGRTAEPQK